MAALSALTPACVLFVANVPWEMRVADLQKLLQQAGPVLRLDLKPDQAGRHEYGGQGHVVYANEEAATRATEAVNGTMVAGRALKVARSKDTSHAERIVASLGGGAGGGARCRCPRTCR